METEKKMKNVKTCRRCGKHNGGIITRYSLNYCRQCFREIAEEIGFKKFN